MASRTMLLFAGRSLRCCSSRVVPRLIIEPQRCLFSTTSACTKKGTPMPPRPKMNEDEIEEVFIKGGGKGGQKINKTNSKVQLRHIPTGLIVSSQATRSREQNRKIARRKMAEELQFQNDPENSRRGKLIEKKQKSKRNQRKKALKRARQREADKLGLAGPPNSPQIEGDVQSDAIDHEEPLPIEAIEAKTTEHEVEDDGEPDQEEIENDLRILREIEEEERQEAAAAAAEIVDEEYETEQLDFEPVVDLLSSRKKNKKKK
ncbi:RF-1 domain-containing protein [Myxozyma melibiosi]|uniref:RF-1 domain-containing protein n=1 Tax=Myxozyma melibiosi TaxID=54550 RepID=A0ABR1F4Y5_9ASCO